MYEELLRCLREHAKPWNCADNCICRDAVKRGYGSCSDELAKLAADAIEELSKRVPPVPHGRLIDADVLTELCRDMQSIEWNKHAAPYSWAYAYEDFENVILDAPAIIEAEEATQKDGGQK